MDFGNGSNSNGFGFPPLGQDEFGPDFGFPSRQQAKEIEEIQPTDEAAILQIVEEGLDPWQKNNRFAPEFFLAIKDKLLGIFKSTESTPNVSELEGMIKQAEAVDTALSQEIKTIARRLLKLTPEIPEMQTNSFYKDLMKEEAELPKTIENNIDIQAEKTLDFSQPQTAQPTHDALNEPLQQPQVIQPNTVLPNTNVISGKQPETIQETPNVNPTINNVSTPTLEFVAKNQPKTEHQPTGATPIVEAPQPLQIQSTIENDQDIKPVTNNQPIQQIDINQNTNVNDDEGIHNLPLPQSDQIQNVDLSDLDKAA
jgi:hypothetical protein